jgi:hypothetical protein
MPVLAGLRFRAAGPGDARAIAARQPRAGNGTTEVPSPTPSSTTFTSHMGCGQALAGRRHSGSRTRCGMNQAGPARLHHELHGHEDARARSTFLLQILVLVASRSSSC